MASTTVQLLPAGQWTAQIVCRPDGQLFLMAGFFINSDGWLHSAAIPFSNFSQNLTSIDDLKRLAVASTESETG